MVTTVGSENDTKALIKNLIQLEHDAIAAYDAVIEKLEDASHKDTVRDFRMDHEGHLKALENLAEEHHAYDPQDGSMKSMLTTGKVNMANMVGGDSAILQAMSTNETDTVSAYRKASENDAAPEQAKEFFRNALADEERHKSWMDTAANAD